jgi:hypothetical protein
MGRPPRNAGTASRSAHSHVPPAGIGTDTSRFGISEIGH